MSIRTLGLAAALSLAIGMTVPAASIIWVDEGFGGFAEWQALLATEGHTLTQRTDMDTHDQEKLATLNAADLVIISRDTTARLFDDGQELINWDGLTVPVMQTNGLLSGSNHWRWLNSPDISGVGPDDKMLLITDHPIFEGVGRAGDEVTLLTGTSDLADVSDAGDGKVLATHTDGRLWIVHWDIGIEFYPGSDHTPSSPRMWMGLVSRDGGMDLSPEGKRVFLNAVRFLARRPPEPAYDPAPSDGETDVVLDTVLSWRPGEFAASHDVYLGTSPDDVNDATLANPLGVLASAGQDANTFDPGGLEFDQAYAWRVDEVNGPPDFTRFKGRVWQFTAEATALLVEDVKATASSAFGPLNGPEKTVDGSGMDAENRHGTNSATMWISGTADTAPWIQYEFSGALLLQEIRIWNSNQGIEPLLGNGVKEVLIETSLDGTNWTPLSPDPIEIAQAPGQPTAVNSVINAEGTLAQYVRMVIESNWGGFSPQMSLAEVQFTQIPVRARRPFPADGSRTDSVDVTAIWRSGRGALSHQVYLGRDAAAVEASDPATLVATVAAPEHSLDLGDQGLLHNAEYVWKVNEDTGMTIHEGELWRFTTPPCLVIDNFESYDDECNRIFFSWQDGLGHNGSDLCGVAAFNGNGSGSIVGNAAAPFAERAVRNSGSQSMPLEYSGPSQASLSLAGQNWQVQELTRLALSFRGEEGNTGQLYLQLDGARIPFAGDPGALSAGVWTEWSIDLNGTGANLARVDTLTIGIDGPGAQGKLFVDDICVYRE